MTDEELEALPARKVAWMPQYVDVTQAHLEELLRLGWVSAKELRLWGRNRLAPEQQARVDNQLALLAMTLEGTPVQ